MKKLFVDGKPVEGKTIPIPKRMLATYSSVIGALYEVDMDVKVKDPSKLTKENFEIIKRRLYEKLHAKVKYFEVAEHNGEYRAVMQLKGSPFSFAALTSLLIELAPLIGLVIIGLVVYYVTKKHPGTAALLFYGILLFLIFGGATSLLKPPSGEESTSGGEGE